MKYFIEDTVDCIVYLFKIIIPIITICLFLFAFITGLYFIGKYIDESNIKISNETETDTIYPEQLPFLEGANYPDYGTEKEPDSELDLYNGDEPLTLTGSQPNVHVEKPATQTATQLFRRMR